MSAREVAEQIVDDFGYKYEHLATVENANALTAAIEAALVAERERCAKVAEGYADLEPWYDTHSSEVGEAEAIAAAIRAGEEG